MEKIIEKVLNAGIDHLKRSPTLHGAVKVADKTMDVINSHLVRDSISLDTLAAGFSNETDKLILDVQRNEGLLFVGGKLLFSLSQESAGEFSIALMLYFKNKEGKFLLKEQKKSLPLTFLEMVSIEELKGKNEISYEVEAP